MVRFDCRTLSQLQDRVLHEPAILPALLDFLTVPVSEMFRDPAYFRALREQVVPLLRTYPSLKIWVAGCSTGEEVYSLAILLREEGLLDAHAHLRHRHQPADAAEGGGRGLRRRSDRGVHRKPPAVRRRDPRCPTTTWPPTDAPSSTSRCRRHIVFSDHSLATDSVFAEVQLVSCRNVLIYFNRELQDRALGCSVRRCAARDFWASAPRNRCASRRTPTRFADFVRERADLPEAGLGMTLPGHSPRRPRRCDCHRRVGGRRGGAVGPAAGVCRPAFALPVFIVLHLPREPAQPAAGNFQRANARCRSVRRRTRSRVARARSISPRRTIIC